VSIEHIAKSHIRKEDVVARALEQHGDHPGRVHIISAMEACDAYKPWHDKQTHKTFVKRDSGKCLHYYFYFMANNRRYASRCAMTGCGGRAGRVELLTGIEGASSGPVRKKIVVLEG
jgi:hypothetical protein